MNNDKKLVKELSNIFNELVVKNNKKSKKSKKTAFFGPDAKSLFTRPTVEDKPNIIRKYKGGTRKKRKIVESCPICLEEIYNTEMIILK